MTVIEYIEACKIKLDVSSSYALSRELDIPENYISDFYKGKRVPDELVCFKFADCLGLSPTLVIAEINAQNEKKPDKALFFKHFLTTVGLWITLAVIPLFLGSHSESVQANGKSEKSFMNQHKAPLYEVIKSQIVKLLRLLFMVKNEENFA